MSKKVIALKSKSIKNYYLLPTPDGYNMIMDLRVDGTWRFKKGSLTWKELLAYGFHETLYELVVD